MSFDRWFEDSVETTRIDLGDGKWIECANYLTAEEDLIIKNAALVGVRREKTIGQQFDQEEEGSTPGTETSIKIDAVRQKFARMQVYVKAWNAKNKDGSAMPVALSSFRRLHPKAFEAIDKALDAHVEVMTGKGKASGAHSGAPSSESASGSASAIASI